MRLVDADIHMITLKFSYVKIVKLKSSNFKKISSGERQLIDVFDDDLNVKDQHKLDNSIRFLFSSIGLHLGNMILTFNFAYVKFALN